MLNKLLFIALAVVPAFALAGKADLLCSAQQCHAGDTGTTIASRSDPYYSCPTRELADYIALVQALVSAQMMMTGHPPNISDKTGDPEYLDSPGKPNKTKLMLDYSRDAAKVKTFDEALRLCKAGKSGVRVTILNVPNDGVSMWVTDEKNRISFWLPKSNLERK